MRERAQEAEDNHPVDIDLEDIIKVVCSEFGIRAQRVVQRERSREISQVRWMIGKLATEQASDRLVEVARYINRDPGVISRGLRKLEVHWKRIENYRQELVDYNLESGKTGKSK